MVAEALNSRDPLHVLGWLGSSAGYMVVSRAGSELPDPIAAPFFGDPEIHYNVPMKEKPIRPVSLRLPEDLIKQVRDAYPRTSLTDAIQALIRRGLTESGGAVEGPSPLISSSIEAEIDRSWVASEDTLLLDLLEDEPYFVLGTETKGEGNPIGVEYESTKTGYMYHGKTVREVLREALLRKSLNR